MVAGRFLWFRSFVINDPDGIRRVLRDHAANYPKSPILRRILVPSLGQGLVTSEGETWRRHRLLIAPCFDRHHLAAYASIMTAAARDLAAEWSQLAPGTVVDVSAAMMTLTAQIICRTMFSTDAGDIVGLFEASVEALQVAAQPNLLDLLGAPEPIAGCFRLRRVQREMAPLDAAINRLIAARLAAPTLGSDLLGTLLSARDDATGQGLSSDEVRDELVTFFLAGHETTALALTWTWYLLSLHPAAEAKLQEELREVLGSRTPTQEDAERLVYTRMVLQESLRLYPPAYSISSRRAVADDEVSGTRIPKGSYVFVMPWVLHRHRSLWKDPERFDPERFEPEASAARNRYAYLPFSAGPRVCIGAGFAMLEATLLLATLAQRFQPRLAPGFPVVPQGLVTLRAAHGMRMTLHPPAA